MIQSIRPQVDLQNFKDVMTCWSSGVTIVTSRLDTTAVGMTVSSFTSVSLLPPQILICVDHKANTRVAITASGYFAVNLMGVEHIEWTMRFAGRQPAVTDRFEGITWFTAETGAPLLLGGLGRLDCRLSQADDSGDHTLFVGEVVACNAADLADNDAPLLYFRRSWHQLAGF